MLLFTILVSWTTVHYSNCQGLESKTFGRNSAETPLKFDSSNTTLARAGYGLIQFEGQNTPSNFISFADNGVDSDSYNAINGRPLKFDNNNEDLDKLQDEYNQDHVAFENDKKKKKKRRRKSKQTPGINRPGFQYNNGVANNIPDFGLRPNLNPGANRPASEYIGQDNLYSQFGSPPYPNYGLIRPGVQYSQSNLSPNFGGIPNPNPGLQNPGQYHGQPNFNPELGGPYSPNTGLLRPGPDNNGASNFYQGIGSAPYRPHRRPRPSLASQALSTVTDALTSIAAYDDYQCVPRLLCEAAGGGALGDSQIIQSASRLQPLLTVLSAYSGISTNPLFVFGRAVFLGASSKESPGSCRYAYPLCPADTEQLVHYLNNHNGGFFRFFNAPQQGQQNLEQFYDQLSQNYGLYQPNQIPNQYGSPNIQNQQSYGYYKPNLYSMNQQQNYGVAYPYNYNANNQIQFKNTKASHEKDDEIQKRILNKPDEDILNEFDDEQSTWAFPDLKDDNLLNSNNNYDITDTYNYDYNHDARKEKTLKFPEQENVKNNYNNFNKNVREFVFPDNQEYSNYNDFSTSASSDNRFVFGSRDTSIRNERYPKMTTNYFEDGSQTVYVVRGNGDPNKPEIIRLKPGESI